MKTLSIDFEPMIYTKKVTAYIFIHLVHSCSDFLLILFPEHLLELCSVCIILLLALFPFFQTEL